MSRETRDKIIVGIIVALILAAFFAALIGIQWLRAGGDWGCVFSQDPPICVAVKAGR